MTSTGSGVLVITGMRSGDGHQNVVSHLCGTGGVLNIGVIARLDAIVLCDVKMMVRSGIKSASYIMQAADRIGLRQREYPRTNVEFHSPGHKKKTFMTSCFTRQSI